MKDFLKDTAYRSAYTFAEVILGYLVVGSALEDIGWKHIFSVAFVAMLICILKQVVVYAKKHFNKDYEYNEMDDIMAQINAERSPDYQGERFFTDEDGILLKKEV